MFDKNCSSSRLKHGNFVIFRFIWGSKKNKQFNRKLNWICKTCLNLFVKKCFNDSKTFCYWHKRLLTSILLNYMEKKWKSYEIPVFFSKTKVLIKKYTEQMFFNCNFMYVYQVSTKSGLKQFFFPKRVDPLITSSKTLGFTKKLN